MKKLSLLSLLILTVLVFQNCKKHPSVEDDLVPIAFSEAAITKNPLAIPAGEEVVALVLGSETPNDWKTIYESSVSGDGFVLTKAHANSQITFNNENNSVFSPEVFYPIADAANIFIKALAPVSAIAEPLPTSVGTNTTNNTVVFIITGHEDVMATGKTGDTWALNAHGVGNRKNPSIDLVFDHLLSKINFLIKAENPSAQSHWGEFKSITFKNGDSQIEYNLTSHTTKVAPTSQKTDFKAALTTPLTIPTATKLNPCSLIVYPPPPAATWTIVVETTNETREILVDLELLEGSQHDITLTFNEIKVINVTSVPVAVWDNNTGSSGAIEGIK